MKKIFTILLASILALGGIFAFAGCKNEFGLLEQNSSGMVSFERWGETSNVSTVEVNLLTFTGEDGSSFVCSTRSKQLSSEGKLLCGEQEGVSVIVSNGETVFWSARYCDDAGAQVAENDVVWIEVINQKDTHILGYAIVRVDKASDFNYQPTLVKAVTFPQVNGKYQAVTAEQVAQLIGNEEKN